MKTESLFSDYYSKVLRREDSNLEESLNIYITMHHQWEANPIIMVCNVKQRITARHGVQMVFLSIFSLAEHSSWSASRSRA